MSNVSTETKTTALSLLKDCPFFEDVSGGLSTYRGIINPIESYGGAVGSRIVDTAKEFSLFGTIPAEVQAGSHIGHGVILVKYEIDYPYNMTKERERYEGLVPILGVFIANINSENITLAFNKMGLNIPESTPLNLTTVQKPKTRYILTLKEKSRELIRSGSLTLHYKRRNTDMWGASHPTEEAVKRIAPTLPYLSHLKQCPDLSELVRIPAAKDLQTAFVEAMVGINTKGTNGNPLRTNLAVLLAASRDHNFKTDQSDPELVRYFGTGWSANVASAQFSGYLSEYTPFQS